MPAVSMSRYEFSPTEVDDLGRKFLDVQFGWTRERFPDDSNPVVAQGDTLFSFSWLAYEEALDPEEDVRPSGWWWVLAYLNDIVDALVPLGLGSRVRVPELEDLTGTILEPPQFRNNPSGIDTPGVVA